MIVIEIRIGREPSAVAGQPTASSMAGDAARAPIKQARKSAADRWIWRVGRRGVAAAVASVLGVASLAFVPGSSSRDDSAAAFAADTRATGSLVAVGEIAPHIDAADSSGHEPDSEWRPSMQDGLPVVTPELDRRARQLTAAALERIEARATASLQAELPQPVDDNSIVTPSEPDAVPAATVAQSDATVNETASEEPGAPMSVPSPVAAVAGVDVDAPSEAGIALPGDVAAAAVVAAPAVMPVGAESSGDRQSGTDDGGRASPAPVSFSITRADHPTASASPGAPVADAWPAHALHAQLGAVGERAAANDWPGVRALLEPLRAGLAASAAGAADPAASTPELALTLAKWDARAALAIHQPERAVDAFEGLESQVDDEARALRAVAWLRAGDAPRAVDAYRDLLVRAPHDARLWLGLALALESSADAPDAARFAYLQTLELAQDEAVRAVARARLVPPQA